MKLCLVAWMAHLVLGTSPAAGQEDQVLEDVGESEDASLAEDPDADPGPVQWRWEQVLAAPRIGGRLRSVAVDPRNANRIFVGTEEGTILRSVDGGVSWRELELSPFVMQARTVRPLSPGLPRLGATVANGLVLFRDPPFRRVPTDRRMSSLPLNTVWFSIRPDFVFVGFMPVQPGLPQALLHDATRPQRNRPVRRIIICPTAQFPLLVATDTEILGSLDDGLTYLRLLRIPGGVTVDALECDENDPSDIMVGTSFGMFRSTDGGASFDMDLSGWPGREATAVRYGGATEDGGKRLFVATGHVLFVGDPDSPEGMVMRYPDFDNVETAPWQTIRWIERAGGGVWLATDDGVRASFDDGISWQNIDPNFFGRHRIRQVVVGSNEQGGTRIAVLAQECLTGGRCRNSLIYASDDGGQTWEPFLQSGTRRTIEQMTAAPGIEGVPPRWWAVTGGELWATVQPGDRRRPAPVQQDDARWARQRLRQTPPLNTVINGMLQNLQLDRGDINRVTGAIDARNYIPLIHFELNMVMHDFEEGRTERPDPILNVEGLQDRIAYEGWLYATWVLPEVNQPRPEVLMDRFVNARGQLYELRRQVSFVAEDAWHERRLQLQHIANGMTDPLQIEILRERVAALEAVLETWLGRSLDEL